MAAPVRPITLGARSATLGIGDFIIFRNFTNGGVRRVRCNASGEAVVKDPPANWANGDTILVEVQGKYRKGTTATVSAGGINVNLGTMAAGDQNDADTAALNL